MAALIREPPRGGSAARRVSLRASPTSSTCRRSRARPAAAATARRPVLERRLDREITAFVVREFVAVRAAARPG